MRSVGFIGIFMVGAVLWLFPAYAWIHGKSPGSTTIVITNVSPGTPSVTSAAITATFTPAAFGRVCYGVTPSLGTCLTRDASATTSFAQTITGLTSSTLYYYQVDATHPGDMQGFTGVQNFITNSPTPTCPVGTFPYDGCQVSNGIYYVPATNVQGDGWSTTKPTLGEWATYAIDSGQAWASNHPQPYNVTGLDYGAGPSALVSSLIDIANYPAGTSNCAYMPNAANAAASTTAQPAATFTADFAGSTFTLKSNVVQLGGVGVLAPGDQISGSGVPAGAIATGYISGGANSQSTSAQWGLSISAGSHLNVATSAYDYPQQVTNWPTNPNGDTHGFAVPAFVCFVVANTPFTVSGYNFGPNTTGPNPPLSPAGTAHGCVQPVIVGPGPAPSPTITFTNNAFINGPGCAQAINTKASNMFYVSGNFRGTVQFIQNFWDGRSNDAGNCCLLTSAIPNTGSLISAASEGQIVEELNYEINVSGSLVQFATGNETNFPCSNGESSALLTAPGYGITSKWNVYPMGFVLGGQGHWEHITLSGTGIICNFINDYNTGIASGTVAAQNTGAYFGYTNAFGTMERFETEGNTLVENYAAGKTFLDPYDFANWYTTGTNPNYLVVTGNGTNCSPLSWSCTTIAAGQVFTGGTNNLYNSQIFPNGTSTSGTVPSSLQWTAGCNTLDNASGICQKGNGQVTLSSGVSVPTPAVATAASTVAAGTTVPLTGGACPTAPQGGYANANLFDTQSGIAAANQIWIGKITTCTTGTITLASGVAATVTSGDSLRIQNQVLNSLADSRQSRLAAFMSHGNITYFTATAGSAGPYTGSTVDLTAASCPVASTTMAGSVLTDTRSGQTRVGLIKSCASTSGHAVLTLFDGTNYPNVITHSVANGDPLTVASYAYGHFVAGADSSTLCTGTPEACANYMDGLGTGAQVQVPYIRPVYWGASIDVSGAGGFSSGTAGGGCAIGSTIAANVDLKGGTPATTESIASGSYNAANGTLTYNFAGGNEPWGASPPATAIGSWVEVSGVTISSGVLQTVNNGPAVPYNPYFLVLNIRNSGTTVDLQSSGAATGINSGTGTLKQSAGPFPQVNLFDAGTPGSIAGGC